MRTHRAHLCICKRALLLACAVVVLFAQGAYAQDAVSAWGYNEFGQCTIPINVQRGAEAIACGVNHTMALKDGQVLAWGSNASNQCTIPLDAQSGVTAIAGGGYFSIALKESGAVLAWGDNGNQQCNVPINAQSGVTAIAGGQYHTAALKAGAVLGWGSNGSDRSTTPSAAQSGVSAIACGYYHTLALKAGEVLAWGENTERQCDIPIAAQSGVTAIAGGMAHSIALKDGQVFAWGQNNRGQCTVPDVGQSNVTAIAGCAEATIALMGGQLFAWGSNDFGQCLGTDSNGNPIIVGPTGQPIQIRGAVLNGVTDIAGGQFHASAIQSGGGNEPVISSVSPSCGPQLGGTKITITGTNFIGAFSVTVGGVPATNVVVVSETVVTAVTPSTSVIGTKNVSVSTNEGSATQIGGFSYVAALSDFSNGGFEAYSISGSQGLVNGNVLFSSAPAFYGWRTTASDNQMEIWKSGFQGVPSHSGNQFAELNANQASQLFQEISGIGAGQNVAYSFAHRGRSGVEQMRFRLIDLGPDNASGGGNDTELENRVVSTGTAGWVVYTGSNTALGNLIQFRFESMGGGSSGNFLDSVQFGDLPSITSVSPTFGTTLGGTAITISGNHFTGASTVTVGAVAATSVIVVSETIITAVTPAGTAGVSDVVVTTVGGTATGAFSYIDIVEPNGVAASDGTSTSQIAVTWNATPNAIAYQVWRDAQKIADIASGATTSYNDAAGTLIPGTLYTYTVKAEFTAGVSGPSTGDTGFRKLSAPTSVACAGAQTGFVRITWNAAVGATSYEILRNGTTIGTSPTAQYDDLTATIGVNFSYAVKSVAATGSSELSTPPAIGWRAPEAPTGLNATDGTFTDKITVSWNAVPSATGYEVKRDGAIIRTAQVQTTTTFNDVGAVGQTFSYTVTASTAAGLGAPSAANTGFINVLSPTNVAATDGTSTQHVDVTWSSVANAVKYQIFRSGTTGAIASTSELTYRDALAVPGKKYNYYVRAVSSAGALESPVIASASSLINSGYRKVSAPQAVNATDGLADKVTVTWAVSEGATGYTVYRIANGGVKSLAGSVIGNAVVTCDDVTAVMGTLYNYTVEAASTAGVSDASAGNTGYRMAPPTGVRASEGTLSTQVLITWTAAVNATGYQVLRRTNSADTPAIVATVAGETIISASDTSASPNVVYIYSVRAISAAGPSIESLKDNGYRGMPAPSGVAASDGAFESKIDMTWSPIDGAIGYEVMRNGDLIGSVSTTTYSDASFAVSPNVNYLYTVKARFSSTQISAASTGNYGWRGPAPTGFQATSDLSDGVELTWNKIPGVALYRIYRGGDQLFIKVDARGAMLKAIDTIAVAGTFYTYTVRAVLPLGLGPSTTATGVRGGGSNSQSGEDSDGSASAANGTGDQTSSKDSQGGGSASRTNTEHGSDAVDPVTDPALADDEIDSPEQMICEALARKITDRITVDQIAYDEMLNDAQKSGVIDAQTLEYASAMQEQARSALVDLILQLTLDYDKNGVLDACQRHAGDVDLSGVVDDGDMVAFINALECGDNMVGDLNCDGVIDGADFGCLLGAMPAPDAVPAPDAMPVPDAISAPDAVPAQPVLKADLDLN